MSKSRLDVDVSTLEKIGEGRQAEMYALDDGRALRLYHAGFSASSAMDEMFNQRLAGDAGVRVPQVYDVQTVDGRLGVIMERIDGTDLLTEVGRKPWRIYSIATQCGKVHARLNSVLAPLSLTPAVERYTAIIGGSSQIPDDLRGPALKRIATLSEGAGMCHLDFHPANVMEQDGVPVVIDWSNAARGPAEVDYARSMLILQLGDPPPGTALTLRILAFVGRRIFRALYSRAYRNILKLDDAQVSAWALPVAVARLGDGIEPEREALLAHIRLELARS